MYPWAKLKEEASGSDYTGIYMYINVRIPLDCHFQYGKHPRIITPVYIGSWLGTDLLIKPP